MICRIMRFSMPLGLMFMLTTLQPVSTLAQEHVVSSSELQKDINQAAKTREGEEAKIAAFLGTPQAKKALRSADVDYKVVQNGVHLLSDQEVAQLAGRAEKAQADFAAGALTNQELTYIIIALATAVIILIIVYR